MQINDILNQLNQQTTAAGNMTNTSPVTEEYSEGNRTLSDLKEGEVFEGTVMDVENGKVTISLANGSSILARLDAGVTLTQGLATFFQVKSNQGGQIALKAVTQDNFSNPTLVRALTQAGVQVSERNLELVKEMMSQQLPIDSRNLLSMVRAANTFSSASVATLTQLNKLSLPINELNIEQLEHYNQGEGQIRKNLESIMKALPELIREAPGQSEGLTMAKQVLSLFASELQASMTEISDGESGAAHSVGRVQEPSVGGQAAAQESTAGGQPADVDQPAVQGQPESGGQAAGIDQPAVQEQLESGGQMTGIDQLPTQEQPLVNGQMQNPAAPGTNPSVIDMGTNPLITDMGADSSVHMEMNTPLAVPSDSGSLNDLDPNAQLSRIIEWIDQRQVSKEEVSELFGKQSFQELLQNAVRKQWFISPRDVEDKQKLEKLYERIDRQMSRLQEIFTGAGHKDSPVVRQMADTRSNIHFINQLNHVYNYVQIPLRMANQNATGDLYVYTNRKSLAKNGGELSAHLHLEMEHLGTTDVFVRLNAKKLSTNFVLEDAKSLELVMEHIDILTDRLQKKGYETDIQIKESPNMEQQGLFMQEVMGQQQVQAAVSRYSFDVKV